MRIDLPWGKGTVPLEVPPEVPCTIVRPRAAAAGATDGLGLVRRALESDEFGLTFREFLSSLNGTLLCVVNDGTRPTPTNLVLQAMEPLLADTDASFLVATGSHGPPNQTDLEQIFGSRFLAAYRSRIRCHDSRHPDSLVALGVTTRGTPVSMDRDVVGAPALLLINSVEPHYFAGYTGGRKSLFPGVAAFESIQANHRLALESGAATLALDGNPVHEDALEALNLLERASPAQRIYSVQLVLDRHQKLASVHAGELGPTFAAAVTDADGQFVVDIPEAADIVVTVAAYPMDYDLYQSQKALSAGVLALKKGGILILVSRCRHGIGDEAFFRLLSASPTPATALETIHGGFVLGYHKAAHLARIAEWGEMWAVADIPDDQLQAAFIRPFSSVQTALDSALRLKGPDVRVIVLTDASMTVPRVRPAP